MLLPWVEKYRPATVDEVSYQDEVTKTLKNSIESGKLPHLLFYGPPGTGKTSTILALAKQLFGAEYKNRVLELNASDERGIKVVREKIKVFAQMAVSNSKTIPPYKLIILDEADAMTPDAQAALRRTMEVHTKVTRFCLICNYVSRIIDPLASRCAKFRFKPLEGSTIKDRIRHICEKEDVKVHEEQLDSLVDISGGDMRKAITYLQSAARLGDNEIDGQDLLDVAAVIPTEAIHSFIASTESNSFEKMQSNVTDFVAAGYPPNQFLSQVLDDIIASTTLDDIQKAKIAQRIAEADKAFVDGADEYLQLLDVGAHIMRVTHNLNDFVPPHF